jgi:hypothetical protein
VIARKENAKQTEFELRFEFQAGFAPSSGLSQVKAGGLLGLD